MRQVDVEEPLPLLRIYRFIQANPVQAWPRLSPFVVEDGTKNRLTQLPEWPPLPNLVSSVRRTDPCK
jgi:hypothetical protein